MLVGHPPETIKFMKIEVILSFNYPLAECLTPSRHQLRLDELIKESQELLDAWKHLAFYFLDLLLPDGETFQ